MNPFNIFKVDPSIGATRQDHILSIVWIYFMLFPTGTLFNISVPLLLLLLYDRRLQNNKIMLPFVVFTIVSTVLNLGYSYMNFKVYARAAEIVVCFFTFASLKGNKILFPYIWFALFYILLSQVSAMFNIPGVYAFFDRTYHITEQMLESYQMDMYNLSGVGESSRLGGMYINPNVCASYVTVLYALGLSQLDQLAKNKKLVYLFVALTFYSFWTTGSRTSLICFLAISGYYLYVQGYEIKRYILLGVALLAASVFVDIGESRMLDVESGMNNSFGAKMTLFGIYLTNCDNPIHFIFGGGDIAASGLYNHSFDGGTDCDFGNIFIVFGAIFWALYWVFYARLFRFMKKEYRPMLFTLLWCFSNSLLISFRMCPVWLVSLGILYKLTVMEKQRTL